MRATVVRRKHFDADFGVGPKCYDVSVGVSGPIRELVPVRLVGHATAERDREADTPGFAAFRISQQIDASQPHDVGRVMAPEDFDRVIHEAIDPLIGPFGCIVLVPNTPERIAEFIAVRIYRELPAGVDLEWLGLDVDGEEVEISAEDLEDTDGNVCLGGFADPDDFSFLIDLEAGLRDAAEYIRKNFTPHQADNAA